MIQKKYTESQLVISFEADRDIISTNSRKYEELLKDKFITPFFVTTGLQEGSDPSIPRFTANSIGNHSKLQISQNRLNLTTRFDDAFCFDIEKITEYLKDRTEFLSKIIGPSKTTFMGVVIRFDVFLEDPNINEYIKNLTNISFLGPDIRDFTYRYSKRHSNYFNINVTVAKFQRISFHIPGNTPLEDLTKGIELKPDLSTMQNGVNIIIDFNNKPLVEMGTRFDISKMAEFFDYFNNINKNNTIENLMTANLK